MRTERKTERTDIHKATAPDGTPADIVETTTFMRLQYMDLTHSEWQVEVVRLTWGRIPVNPREDGDWETAEPWPRRLSRRP